MPPRGRNLPQRTRGNRALQRGRQANPPNPNPQNNVQPRPTGAQPPLNNAGNGAVAGPVVNQNIQNAALQPVLNNPGNAAAGGAVRNNVVVNPNVQNPGGAPPVAPPNAGAQPPVNNPVNGAPNHYVERKVDTFMNVTAARYETIYDRVLDLMITTHVTYSQALFTLKQQGVSNCSPGQMFYLRAVVNLKKVARNVLRDVARRWIRGTVYPNEPRISELFKLASRQWALVKNDPGYQPRIDAIRDQLIPLL